MSSRNATKQTGQAVVETALVLPLLALLVLLFGAATVLFGEVGQLRSATTLATYSSFAVPAGSPAQALGNVNDSFARSAHDRYAYDRRIDCPAAEGNQYLYQGTFDPNSSVTCHGQATVSFRNSIFGLAWLWDVHVTQDATVPVPPYRQCAPGVPSC